MLFIQGLVIPLQGFLNAIVYGWTREEFTHLLAIRTTSEANERRLTEMGDKDPDRSETQSLRSSLMLTQEFNTR